MFDGAGVRTSPDDRPYGIRRDRNFGISVFNAPVQSASARSLLDATGLPAQA